MKLTDIKLFPKWYSMPWRNDPKSATRKGYLHKHNPVWLPVLKLTVTPAMFRHTHKGVTKKQEPVVHKIKPIRMECMNGCGRMVLRTRSICRKCWKEIHRSAAKKDHRILPVRTSERKRSHAHI